MNRRTGGKPTAVLGDDLAFVALGSRNSGFREVVGFSNGPRGPRPSPVPCWLVWGAVHPGETGLRQGGYIALYLA